MLCVETGVLSDMAVLNFHVKTADYQLITEGENQKVIIQDLTPGVVTPGVVEAVLSAKNGR